MVQTLSLHFSTSRRNDTQLFIHEITSLLLFRARRGTVLGFAFLRKKREATKEVQALSLHARRKRNKTKETKAGSFDQAASAGGHLKHR